MPTNFDMSSAWVLSEQVALRPESFGALAYHFGTRRLSFLKSPVLVGLVRSLGEYPSAHQACGAFGIDTEPGPMLTALETLAGTGTIVRRERA